MLDIQSLRALCVCMCVCVCVRACACVCVFVCILCAFSSWSSKGALANLQHSGKARDIEEAVAKSDWSTARDLLREVYSGKHMQMPYSCHI